MERVINNFNYYLNFIKLTVFVTFFLNIFVIFSNNIGYLYVVPLFSVIGLISLGVSFYRKNIYLLSVYAVFSAVCRIIQIHNLYEFTIFYSIVIGVFYLSIYILIIYISQMSIKMIFKLKENNLNIITALTNALHVRDVYTNRHSEKVAKYSLIIAEEMGLSNETCSNIYISGLLHDIGKIGVPEAILLKTDKLTKEEFDEIKKHPQMGYDMIKHMDIFQDKGILDNILYHHERFDGKGYPKGLKGFNIPLTARIISVADSFDAMNSNRNYRNKLDLRVIMKELESNKGTQFDAEVVDTFLKLLKLYNSPENLLSNYKKGAST